MQLINRVRRERPVKLADSNAKIRQRVSCFLRSRHFATLRNIEIQVDRGEVTLTGSVQSYYEKQIALTSQSMAGVVSLVDKIVVQQKTERRDGVLQA